MSQEHISLSAEILLLVPPRPVRYWTALWTQPVEAARAHLQHCPFAQVLGHLQVTACPAWCWAFYTVNAGEGGEGVRSLGEEGPLEKEMATHSSTLAWKVPQTEEPGELQSMGSQRLRHNWATNIFSVTVLPWEPQTRLQMKIPRMVQTHHKSSVTVTWLKLFSGWSSLHIGP